MKRIELTKDRKALYLSTGGALLAEFLGTNAQGLELVAKFNQHAELVKALRAVMDNIGVWSLPGDAARKAQELLTQIDAGAAQ